MFRRVRFARRMLGTVVWFSVVASILLAGVVACGGPAATATMPAPTFPPPTATPDPYARHSAQPGAVASAYWSGPVTWEPEDVSRLERVTQKLAVPPFLPKHDRSTPALPG